MGIGDKRIVSGSCPAGEFYIKPSYVEISGYCTTRKESVASLDRYRFLLAEGCQNKDLTESFRQTQH